jgi:CspA family cold shock protein
MVGCSCRWAGVSVTEALLLFINPFVSKPGLRVYHITHRGESPGDTSAAKWQVERGLAMAKGTIKKLISDKGFGFIQTAEGKDLFFHRSQLEGLDYSSLKEGQEVEYEVGTGRGGRPEATKVKLASSKTE